MKREEPFNVLANRNSWDRVPRDPVSTAVAAFVAVEGTFLYTAVYYATQAVISWATSALLSALMPAPPSPKQSLLVNARDAAAPQEIVYGTARKGGPITYLETVDGGETLYQIILLASHEIEDVEAIYINDEIAVLSGDSFGPNNRGREGAGWVLNNNWTDDPGEHEVRILYHRGNQTSITDTFANSSVASMSNTLFAESENFGGTGQPSASSFVGSGMAFLLVRYGYAGSVFQYGLPKITAKIKGKKVYDPRTGATAHSDNAALCIRDYLTSSYGLNDPEVDETSFQVAANDCDEVIALGTTEAWNITDEGNGTYAIGGPLVTNGGVVYRRYRNPFSLDDGRFATTPAQREPGVGSDWQFFWEVYVEKRYTINGVVRTDQSYGDILQQMMTACAGTLFWGGGKWKLQAGVYNSPTKTLTLDDLRSNINLQTRVNLRDQFNRVQGTFVDANQRYIAADYKEVVSEGSGSFTEQDNNVPQSLNLDLPFTTSYATAQRIAKLTLFRGREQMVFTADFGLNAFDVEVGDIIVLDFSYQLDGETVNRYGWSNKEFEVLGWNFKSDSEEGDLRIALTLRETSEDAFAWDAEESAIISNDSNLISKPSVVTNLNAVADGVTNEDGTFLNSIGVSWDAVDGASAYAVEYRENTTDYSSGRVEEADAVTTREQFIYKGYVEILNRQPDQSGFDYYNTGDGSSLTEIEFRVELENSAEIVSNTFAGTSVSRLSSSYQVTPVKDNTLYDIRVCAINLIGRNGPWTATTFSTAKDDSVPDAPTNLVATAGYGGNEITWDEVTSPLSGDEDWATFTSYVVGDTVNNDSVGYICISGHNSNSSTEPGVGVDWELAWEPYVERLKDLFLYEVYRGTTTAPTTLVGRVTGESFSDTGLADSTEYFYRVKARDFSGNVSDYSTEVSVTTKDLDSAVSAELSAPSAVVAADNDGSNPALPTETTMTVSFGGTDDTIYWAFSRVDGPGVTSSLGGENGNVLTVTGLTNDSGYVDITAEKVGFSDVTKRFIIAKSKQGDTGEDGISTYFASVFRRDSSTPSTPSGGSYDFGTKTLTPPSGWSTSVPSGTDPVYTSTTLASIQGTAGIDSSLSWSTPVLLVQNGATGDRGPGRWYIDVDGTAYSLPITEAEADDAWNATTAQHPARPEVLDQVIFYEGTQSNPTKQQAFICTAVTSDAVHTWNEQEELIDGDLLVTGTITADKISLGDSTLTADGSGNLVVGTLDANKITSGEFTQDRIPTLAQTKVTDLTTDLAIGIGRATTFYAANAPTANNVGDVWYDTTNDKVKRWSGSAWVEFTIEAESVAASWVYAGTLTAGQVNAVDIDAGSVTTGILNANRIGADTITANKLTIGDSSLVADGNGDLIVQGGNITVLEDNFYTPSFPINGNNSLQLVGGALPFIPPTFIAQIQVVVSFGHGYFNLGGGSDGWGYEIYAVDSRSLTAVTADDLVPGSRAQIVTLGTTDWNVVAGTTGVTYAVGDYLDIAEAGTGTGTAYQSNDLDTLKQRNADEVVSGDIIVIDSLGTTTDWNALAGTTGVTYQEGDFFEAVTTGSGDGVVYSDARYTLDARYTTLMSLQDDTPTLVCTMKNVKNFSLDRSWRMPIYVKWVGESSDIRINKCLTSVFLRFK